MTEQLKPESSLTVTFSKELLEKVTTADPFDLLTPKQQEHLRVYTAAAIKARNDSFDQAVTQRL
jgi:hypothetical protein